MQAPDFWFTPPEAPGLAARALFPLGWLYGWATARRVARSPRHEPKVPVICVGNINAGGTGKTPTVIALAQRLAERGRHPVAVSRGYGGTRTGPLLVDPARQRARDVGDEPLLLAAFLPTIVARDRAAGCRMAEEMAACDVIILDDGLQSAAVRRDLALVVVDTMRGFGNRRVIPAGPLREPLDQGLQRADTLLTIGPDTGQRAFDRANPDLVAPTGSGPARLRGDLRPLSMGLPWAGRRVLAFAGIGNPEKFFATLRAEGAEIVRAEALSDHQSLTEPLMRRLSIDAVAATAQLVTTEKDFVRLPPAWRRDVLSVPVRLVLSDWSPLDAALGRLGLDDTRADV